ncbi:MAG: tRNA (adenosine(37)-N6)-dimethylallyltransferase MiaA [Mariprofundaceae bacterium]|nr:tRNA (adenosine(37)-N6)-dimethylallyltransferase MiaA [Mariprofundaceae bacterium]
MSEIKTLKAIALMGATGTGKSALAMKVAQMFHTCIIACDSMQLYRGLDIGTAKPSAEERQAAPHFMIDCADLSDTYSAARWADEAADVIDMENSKGNVPLVVGGTGMYLRALLEGFADIPAEKPEVREQLQALQKEHGTAHLHAMLSSVDPVMAARLHAGDRQRIMRALGVFQSSGKTLSDWQAESHSTAREIECPVIVLEVERGILRNRIAERFDAMMAAGWLDEVRWLDEQHLGEMHPAVRAVGYRQLLGHLHGECSLQQAVRDGITATRRYAKRQQTWFRNQTPDATFGEAEVCFNAVYEVLKS